LPISTEAKNYQPGDIVTWRLPGGQPHIGLVSDRSAEGRPLLVHNIGAGAKVEDVLFAFTIMGHYRYLPRLTKKWRRDCGDCGTPPPRRARRDHRRKASSSP
jgi:hypothetical protein